MTPRSKSDSEELVIVNIEKVAENLRQQVDVLLDFVRQLQEIREIRGVKTPMHLEEKNGSA